MLWGTGDRLTVYRYMYPFLCLIPEQPNNLFERGLAGFGIGCLARIACLIFYNTKNKIEKTVLDELQSEAH